MAKWHMSDANRVAKVFVLKEGTLFKEMNGASDQEEEVMKRFYFLP